MTLNSRAKINMGFGLIMIFGINLNMTCGLGYSESD